MGSAVGLLIGLLVSFGLEFRKQTFLGEWELPPGTVVLGRVPLIQMEISSKIVHDVPGHPALLCCIALSGLVGLAVERALTCT